VLDPSIPVTAHAVLRYMTRVLGLKFTGLSRRRFKLSNSQLVCEAARFYGLDPARLQREICPAETEAAVRSGASRIRKSAYSLICEGGRVVTVIERTCPVGRIKRKEMSRRDRGRMDRRRRAGVK
jgi:hypothetical protein